MTALVAQYCRDIKKRYSAGISTEHSYRGDLQSLFHELVKGVTITNEPKRQECGAPDFIIQKGEVPVGYIEAKDIGIDLDRAEKSDQLKRYKGSLNNLILTDYTEFRFIREGETKKKIKIAEAYDGKFKALPENYDELVSHIAHFCSYRGFTITSSETLARMMAKKARMMEEVIHRALISESDEDSTLKQQFEAFQKILINDLTEDYFADIYAQTIAYGLFAARLHDTTLETFSRGEALFLVPKSNPFLRQLFSYIAGPDLDDRIVWIVDDLAEIFRGTDINALLADFGKATQQNDPFLHFYETFLAEYDARLRQKRGVYYTPEPVVNFIVRAVDEILQTDFNLPQGLADTSKVELKVDIDGDSKKAKKAFHKVQILDPATGTGTFLAEVVKQIYRKFENQKGIWSNYVENELIPRLNGFEILMASYTVCHLKLEMLLRETGYKPKDDNKQQRLRVFLTNSLEEPSEYTGTLFATWLSNEAKEANFVKRDTPVMVVLGNPPYSGHSANKGPWIEGLLKDYKQEPGGGPLKERNPKWLNDDYVKFIRYGQHFIEKNKEGILAFVNNHSFLDNPTFRGMRWSLLTAFDKIYIIDLHGNSKKKETCPDGSPDVNVFDIQQGVSINIFVKSGKKRKNQIGQVFHVDLYGSREDKYNKLWDSQLHNLGLEKLNLTGPQYYFIVRDYKLLEQYEKAFAVNNLFPVNSVGIVSSRDAFVVDFLSKSLTNRIKEFFETDISILKSKYGIKEKKTWKIDVIRNKTQFDQLFIKKIQYRPFDKRHIYFDPVFIERSRTEVMAHFIVGHNIGLIAPKRVETKIPWQHILCSRDIIEHVAVSLKTIDYYFPLYLYPNTKNQQTINQSTERTPNLNEEIVNQIAESLNLRFLPEKEDTEGTFAPIDILDYIYAVLHSPTYREKFKEFLKIDFPRVPYPKDTETFWQLVSLGGELRQIHLLESPVVQQFITSYPEDGDNIITRTIGKKDFFITDQEQQKGRLWINDKQYFDGIPVVAWEFYIGGYQPAQKWLKDRKGRELSYEDIQHYQKIIVALTETDRIMKEIDGVGFFR